MNLQLWEFGDQLPKWAVETDRPQLIGEISPIFGQLVTYSARPHQAYIHIWDVKTGRLLAELLLDDPPDRCPLDITFGSVNSKNQSHSHHGTHCIIYEPDGPPDPMPLRYHIRLGEPIFLLPQYLPHHRWCQL